MVTKKRNAKIRCCTCNMLTDISLGHSAAANPGGSGMEGFRDEPRGQAGRLSSQQYI